MQNIKHITVHSSATRPLESITVEKIREWHKNRGWRDIGYHFVIPVDGIVQEGRPLTQTGAHVGGHNTNNIGICMIGGVDENNKPTVNYTEKQFEALASLLQGLQFKYNVPDENVLGHRDWYGSDPRKWQKECPCFDVQHWLATGDALHRAPK